MTRIGWIAVGLVLAACGDGATAGSQAASTGGGEGGPVTGLGRITVESSRSSGSFVYAYFELASAVPECDEPVDGPCHSFVCKKGEPTFLRSAGSLTVHVGTKEITTSTNSVMEYVGFGPVLWKANGDETVIVGTSGLSAPGFSLSVAAPGYVAVGAPEFPVDDTQPMMLDTTKPLALAWTGGNSGTEVLAQLRSSDKLTGVDCTFPVEAGAGSIPAGALAHLHKGPSGGLFVVVENVASERVAEWDMALYAGSIGEISGHPNGSSNTAVTFE